MSDAINNRFIVTSFVRFEGGKRKTSLSVSREVVGDLT
jgi:hypothetical protein